MPEDPRILTRAKVDFMLGVGIDTMEDAQKFFDHDLAQRERIATLEERNDELRVCFQYANRALPLLRAENDRLAADNRRLREALEAQEDFWRQSKCTVPTVPEDHHRKYCLRCKAIAASRPALQPAAPQRRTRQHEPACDISGRCEARMGATGTTNCIHCGKELVQRPDGNWYTWDAPEDGGLPQYQATPAPQPSGNTGELPQPVCNTCLGEKTVQGPAYGSGQSDTFPCPDCSVAQPATEQPRIWRTGWEWVTSGRATGSPAASSEYEARLGTAKLIDSTISCPHPLIKNPRLQYSTDNGKTWVDEQAEREGK